MLSFLFSILPSLFTALWNSWSPFILNLCEWDQQTSIHKYLCTLAQAHAYGILWVIYSHTHMWENVVIKPNFSIGILFFKRVKIGKVTPIRAWTGSESFRRLKLPDRKTIGTWRWQGCQPYTPAAFTPREKLLVLISFSSWI